MTPYNATELQLQRRKRMDIFFKIVWTGPEFELMTIDSHAVQPLQILNHCLYPSHFL